MPLCVLCRSVDSCLTLCDPRLLCPWNSPGKNSGVGCHSFLQGIFPTQGLNPGVLHCRPIIDWLRHSDVLIRRNLNTERDTKCTHSQREDKVKIQQKSGHLQAKQRGIRTNQTKETLIFGHITWRTVRNKFH